MAEAPQVAVIGGSGLYRLLDHADEIRLDTPYGKTSDAVSIGSLGGETVAFLPRHGRDHELAPHHVPYRANLWALKELGVRRVIAPAASGSLQPGILPGDIVICDQLVDRTSGRADTYSAPGCVIHASLADPYCEALRTLASTAACQLQIRVHGEGTVVVIQGPRFSTRAESRWFAQSGWAVVNMTQYPEVALARELGLCYLNLSVVTDRDAGVIGDPDAPPVTAQSVLEVLRQGMGQARQLISAIVEGLDSAGVCQCQALAAEARI
ncbi:MAG: S-methyl-5'-thioadenosine phosphorylase [Candidatus Dormibacter sp.]|uniref:S-methyl-5'-thioadenosine phosphorylase n=1 Tax=Candidatus Dormibacter sp. TaxID=2973982 RepID=UPI000DB09B77|nr:MAG: S-methyl-5'-thioadenosine phosphorylase [Candidatus Dormibacteraeota bacterium]